MAKDQDLARLRHLLVAPLAAVVQEMVGVDLREVCVDRDRSGVTEQHVGSAGTAINQFDDQARIDAQGPGRGLVLDGLQNDRGAAIVAQDIGLARERRLLRVPGRGLVHVAEGVGDLRGIDRSRQVALGWRRHDAVQVAVLRGHHAQFHQTGVGNDNAAGHQREFRLPSLQEPGLAWQGDMRVDTAVDQDIGAIEASEGELERDAFRGVLLHHDIDTRSAADRHPLRLGGGETGPDQQQGDRDPLHVDSPNSLEKPVGSVPAACRGRPRAVRHPLAGLKRTC